MSLFDILTNAAFGSVLQSMGGGAQSRPARPRTPQAPQGNDALATLGAQLLGAVLGGGTSMGAPSRTNAPHGMGGAGGRNGGMPGGGMGGLSSGGTAALLSAGAVAWQFYQKWAAEKEREEAMRGSSRPAAPQRQEIPGFGGAPSHGADFGAAGFGSPREVRLDSTSELMIRAMVYAARADGTIDQTETGRINAILQSILPGEDLSAILERVQKEPLDPQTIARSVMSQEQAEDIFRLSCTVIDIDHFMEKSYMDALATALHLSPSRRADIETEANHAKRQLASQWL